MKMIDKMFEQKETDSDGSGINFDKYMRVVEDQKIMCNKISLNYGSTFNNLDIKQTRKNDLLTQYDHINTNARNNLNGVYAMLGCPDQFKALNAFAGVSPMRKAVLVLEYNQKTKAYTEMLRDLDK